MSSRNSEYTRGKILKATWKLLSSAGQQTRMIDVAKEAGVSRQAVYLHFPSRAELLIATTEYIDTVEDVAGSMRAVRDVQGGKQKLRTFMQTWGNYIPVIYPVARTLLELKDSDADAAEAWANRMQLLRGVCKTIVEELHKEKNLTQGMSVKEATDVMWSLISVRFWELLSIERGVKQKRYIALMEHVLLSAIADDS